MSDMLKFASHEGEGEGMGREGGRGRRREMAKEEQASNDELRGGCMTVTAPANDKRSKFKG